MTVYFSRILLVFLGLAVFFTPGGAGVRAQESKGCDNAFLDVLKQRAWMEGKREMEMNQTFILKPDSVLEYSCFKNRLDDLDQKGAEWSNREADMKAALDLLVVAALTDYFSNNYYHTMGGGTYTGADPIDCNAMDLIWNFLKCDNFSDSSLLTFKQLSAFDPRNRPEACNEPNRKQKWVKALEDSYPQPARPSAKGSIDKVYTHLEQMYEACDEADPISTGVWIVREGEEYEEHICLPAGCYYDYENEACGG